MLSGDELRQAATDLSSDDLAVSMEAKRKMTDALLPEHIVALCQSEENANQLKELLDEVSLDEVLEVHTVIGGALTRLIRDPALGPSVVTDARYRFIIDFALTTLCHTDTAIANSARPLALAMMETADRCEGRGVATPWAIMDAQLRCPAVLRLFDCDAINSPETNNVCRMLLAHTGLVQFILDETCRLFNEDLLSLFNYLVVCGALSHHVPLPEQLLGLVRGALEHTEDGLIISATCRFCSVALRNSESNARDFGFQWISRSLKALKADPDTVEDAVLDVVGAASTTSTGWTAALASGMESSIMSRRLTSLSDASRSSALHLLKELLASSFVEDAFFSDSLLHEAWGLRNNPEESVRLAVWRVIARVMDKEALRKNLIALIASNLCGAGSHDDSVAVRKVQLEVIHKLLSCNSLPNSTREALIARAERGLYPPGSCGVAAMTRD